MPASCRRRCRIRRPGRLSLVFGRKCFMLTRHLQGRGSSPAKPASRVWGRSRPWPSRASGCPPGQRRSGSMRAWNVPSERLPAGSRPGCVRAGCVFAEDEARLLISAATPADLTSMVERRAAGEPIEHVLGWAEFCGMRIVVDPGVFVPRRRTEFLVAHAIAVTRPRAVVLDMCCGSGAIGAAIAAPSARSSSMPSTSIPAQWRAPAATSRRRPARSPKATSTMRCPRRCTVASTCWSPTPRTFRPTTSR